MTAGGEPFDAYRTDLENIEKRVAGRFRPGRRGVVILAAVATLAVCLSLPLFQDSTGWAVLVHVLADEPRPVKGIARCFVVFATVFGIVVTLAALGTRRWWIACVALLGNAIGSFLGLFAVWSQDTNVTENAHSTPALPVAWLAVVALTALWLPIASSRAITKPMPRPGNPDDAPRRHR